VAPPRQAPDEVVNRHLADSTNRSPPEVANQVGSFIETVPVETGLSSEEGTMIRRAIRFTVSAAIATALVVGISSLVTPASAASRGCICPYIYAPVKCSNGITYTNGCFASCAHATGCVPVFDTL
jgi:hypothetical protein